MSPRGPQQVRSNCPLQALCPWASPWVFWVKVERPLSPEGCPRPTLLNWLPRNEVRAKVSQGAVWQGTEPGQGCFPPSLPSPKARPLLQALTMLVPH